MTLQHNLKKEVLDYGKPHFTKVALSEKLKQDLAKVKLDVDKYLAKIEEIKKTNNKSFYDYELSLDFSNDVLDRIYDDRKYYYKAYHFLKIGLFKNIPAFKVSLADLPNETIYELGQLSIQDRNFVLKQAISKIFEDIHFELYHNSISSILKVEFVDNDDY